jgi:hypothetical protein
MTSRNGDPLDVLLDAAIELCNDHGADDAGRCLLCLDGNTQERCLPYRTAHLILKMWEAIPYVQVAASRARPRERRVA